MQDNAADELHTVRPHAEHAAGCLAADRERIRQDIVGALGSTLKLLADYTRRETDSGNDNFSRMTAPGATADSTYRDNTESVYNIATATLALEKRFSPRWTLKAGAKYTYNDMHNDALYEYRKNDAWSRNDDQSFTINYTENIAAAYGIASANLGGPDKDNYFWGGSSIIGPSAKTWEPRYYAGMPFTAEGADEEAMYTATIDLALPLQAQPRRRRHRLAPRQVRRDVRRRHERPLLRQVGRQEGRHHADRHFSAEARFVY